MDQRLNLARKWRSKDFSAIIGQSLSLRMLKNSLYLEQFFPVYLFSGQRGCGKTTTARVFAASVNCEVLVDFRKSPKEHAVPCNVCVSCKAIFSGKHPDFIEIDAASHTGVDNVRQIIEASSLLPLMGKKKIYLIDEAHMLSKAAFNAFLKILEEPPASVLFILATTDPQKIIETVRSRCFQLFFNAVPSPDLKNHLIQVCTSENITYEENALSLIIQESEGSVRDALNLLEQVRFSAPAVTTDAVLKSLGQLSDEQLVTIFDIILNHDSKKLLTAFSEIGIDNYSTEKFFGRLLELVRASLWVKHHITTALHFDSSVLKKIVASVPAERINTIFQTLCDYETILTKTTKKQLMLEMVLLKLCNASSNFSSNETPGYEYKIQSTEPEKRTEPLKNAQEVVSPEREASSPWDQFLVEVESLNDPFLKSIFVQARFDSIDDNGAVRVCFSERFSFFSDSITDNSAKWLPLLKGIFGEHSTLQPIFEGGGSGPEKAERKKEIATAASSQGREVSYTAKKKTNVIDVSEAEKWQKTSVVLKYFPGTVREVTEGNLS
jgi:DNA polymerase-3 subunit gamma/tau